MHIAVIGGTGLAGRARKNQRIARIQSSGKPRGYANDSRDPGASHSRRSRRSAPSPMVRARSETVT